MNIPELLKYISPLAIFGIIWSIVQFYQKRNTEKKELRRKEKIAVFNNLHSILNSLKNVFLEHQYFINRSYRILDKKVKNFDLNINKHSNKIENIDKQIEILTDNQEKNKDEISHLKSEQTEEFKLYKSKYLESKGIIDNELHLLEKELLRISDLNKDLKKDLNNISLLGLVTDSKIRLEISKLSKQIDDLSLDIESNEARTEFGNLTDKFIQKVIAILEKIYRIESMIYNELN
ncbi:hypothetical protein [Lutibacter citreus]|uniref:hypothetical protein n=1 Tax=Lutibacter citreus TaxID=2138210 RepID=UPI000DBE00D7|nr:hypothetical protein [Lutibacter citreus]